MNFAPHQATIMRTVILFAAVLLAAQIEASAADPADSWKGVKVLPKIGAEVKVDGEPIDSGGFSIPWIVQDTDDELLLVGGQLKGWVAQSEVVTLDDAPAYYSQFTRRYRFEPWAYGMRAFALRENGELLSAIADYQTSLRLKPTKYTYIGRGLALDSHKDYAKALADFKQARRLDPSFALAYNNAAWLRATCRQANFRDGTEAIELATKACELTDWKDASYIDTLAAAYAEAGDFDSAIKYQAKALELNPSEEELKQHAELFKNHQPYHEK